MGRLYEIHDIPIVLSRLDSACMAGEYRALFDGAHHHLHVSQGLDVNANVHGLDGGHPENGHEYAPSAHVDEGGCAWFQGAPEICANAGDARHGHAHDCAPSLHGYVDVHAVQSGATKDLRPSRRWRARAVT